MLKIVILDGFVANPGDIDWSELNSLGELEVYDRTPDDLIVSRAKDADILLTNKCILDHTKLKSLVKLKYIGLLATGYNNIDLDTAKEQNIIVCNAVGYSAASVAQHVFALLLELTNHVGEHNSSVQDNGWARSTDWSYWHKPLLELSGRTMGIYGVGHIGSQVARIALAFGMDVIATRKNREKDLLEGIKLVSEEELLRTSDILSLHAPLSDSNRGFINMDSLQMMKSSAFLINTGRGGLVNETDLKEALKTGVIAGAGLDVLNEEPPQLDHVLLKLPNCIITPHQAWATRESRQRLLSIAVANVKAFIAGNAEHCVY